MSLVRSLKLLSAAAGLALAGTAAAAPVTYNITVFNTGWADTTGDPYGMGLSPSLTGTMTMDSSISGIGGLGLLSFSMTTGSRTWTEADVLYNGSVLYNGAGDLEHFYLFFYEFGNDYLAISSSNATNVSDLAGNWNICYDCVSFAPASGVPEPTSPALVGLALLGAAAARRRA